MRIHWFSITIFDIGHNRGNIWRDYFSALGVLIPTEHGGRGYRAIDTALLGAKVYYDPIRESIAGQQHFHIEIPGKACDSLVPSVFPTLLSELLAKGLRFNVKRLDLAFDDVPFSPKEFLEALKTDEMVSLAKRKNIRIDESPYELSEDGSHVGTTTVYLGMNTAERMIRVYDRRGPVRLEFQLRDKRANAVALNIFSKNYEEWEQAAKGHLRQYLDFCNIDWWTLFVNMVRRENLTVSSARVATFKGLENWLERQVSVALSVWFDVQGDSAKEEFENMLLKAKKRDRSRYTAILQLADEGKLTKNERKKIK